MTQRDPGLSFPSEASSSVHAKRQVSLAQLAVVLALIGVMMSVYLSQISTYQELAEKAAMDTTVINLRTGLRFRIAELLIHGRERDIGALLDSNPAKLLESRLPNYAGEFDSASVGEVPAGRWYFVTDLGELRYRVMRGRNLAGLVGDPPEICFRIGGASQKSGAYTKVEGVHLVLLTKYQWFE